MNEPRPWTELRDTGLLWLINTTVFHPRGYAIAFHLDDDGNVAGWKLLGDGTIRGVPHPRRTARGLRPYRTTLPAHQGTHAMTTPAHGVMARHYHDIPADQADEDVSEIMRLVEATEWLATILQYEEDGDAVCEEAIHAWRIWCDPDRIAWLDQYLPEDARREEQDDE